MPRGLNKVLLIGNLGRDPEMRYTPDGTAVTTFSVASSRMWVTSSGDRREVTEWFNIVAWRRLAEICSQHLSQGSRVYVEGRLQTRFWDDAEGRRHQRVEVVANEMIMLDGSARLAHVDNEQVADATYHAHADAAPVAGQIDTDHQPRHGPRADEELNPQHAPQHDRHDLRHEVHQEQLDDSPSADDTSERAHHIEG